MIKGELDEKQKRKPKYLSFILYYLFIFYNLLTVTKPVYFVLIKIQSINSFLN